MSTADQVSGIYQITCVPTGKVYIGSSKYMRRRRSQHLYRLRRGKHHSPPLQASWNKHGEAAFEWKTLLVCRPEDLPMYEQRALDLYKPCLNSSRSATAPSWDPAARKRASASRCQRIRAHGGPGPYVYNGQVYETLQLVADECGIKAATLYARLKNGESLEEAAARPPHRPTWTYKGVHYASLRRLCEALGIPQLRVRARLVAGWTLTDSIERPPRELNG